MLQAFIITLREGVEAALIVGITLAYLTKIGRAELRKTVYAALVAAFLGSIGVAVVISRTHLNEDVFEGWVMLVAAFFVITMVIFMMKTGRKMKGEIEGKIGLLAGNDAWFGLFIFIFLMVLREGAETVLMLASVSLNSTELMSFLGTLLGVMAAIGFGVMFVKGSVRINLQKFFRVTTVILWFVAAQLIISGLHELSENGVLPSSKQEMALIGPIVRNDVFFFITIFALAALMVLFEVKSRQPEPAPRAPVDGFGLRQLVPVHHAGHGGIHLRQEPERAPKGGRDRVREWPGFHPTQSGFRRRHPLLPGGGKRRGCALLALSEARWQDRDRARCVRDLRFGGLLQRDQRSGLQELRSAH